MLPLFIFAQRSPLLAPWRNHTLPALRGIAGAGCQPELLGWNRAVMWLAASLPPPCYRPCRPEVRFGGLQELLGRINTDIGIARSQLDLPQWQVLSQQLAAAAPRRS